jgi:hypothetical protein
VPGAKGEAGLTREKDTAVRAGTTEGWGVTRAERESFPKGEEYREDWRDLADDGESSTGSEESCEDLANEGENPQEDWGSSTDVEESSTNLQGARRVLRV